VQTARHVGRGNDDTVGFPAALGIGFENLLIFPMALPLAFGEIGIVLGGKVGKACSHGHFWGLKASKRRK